MSFKIAISGREGGWAGGRASSQFYLLVNLLEKNPVHNAVRHFSCLIAIYSPSGASGRLCFVIVAFPGYGHLYFGFELWKCLAVIVCLCKLILCKYEAYP